MAARDLDKATAAKANIVTVHPGASLEIVELDLDSLDSVAVAAEQIRSAHEHVDILVNNAGLMAMPEQTTADGFEMQFGVNHLGHWALTAHLMPALLRANAARIVSVTSTAHHLGRAVDPANPNLRGRYRPWRPTANRSSPTTTLRSGCSASSRRIASPRQRACSPTQGCHTRTCRRAPSWKVVPG